MKVSKTFTLIASEDYVPKTYSPDFDNETEYLADDCPETIIIKIGEDIDSGNDPSYYLYLPNASVWKNRTLTLNYIVPARGVGRVVIGIRSNTYINNSMEQHSGRGFNGWQGYAIVPIWSGRKHVYYSDGIGWILMDNVTITPNFEDWEEELWNKYKGIITY